MPIDQDKQRRIQAELLRAEELRRELEREVRVHLEGIRGARADLETKLSELRGHCERLQQTTRRFDPGDGAATPHRIYCTEHHRLAGAMNQALKRAQGAERLLHVGAEERRLREARERELVARERVRVAVRDVVDLQLPRETDFESLFGEEGVADGA